MSRFRLHGEKQKAVKQADADGGAQKLADSWQARRGVFEKHCTSIC